MFCERRYFVTSGVSCVSGGCGVCIGFYLLWGLGRWGGGSKKWVNFVQRKMRKCEVRWEWWGANTGDTTLSDPCNIQGCTDLSRIKETHSTAAASKSIMFGKLRQLPLSNNTREIWFGSRILDFQGTSGLRLMFLANPESCCFEVGWLKAEIIILMRRFLFSIVEFSAQRCLMGLWIPSPTNNGWTQVKY